MRRSVAAVVVAALALAACGRKDESLAKKAGSKVGETITDLGHGVAAGIERGSAVPVGVSDGLAARGVSATISKRVGSAVSVYVASKDAMDLQLVVKALDRDGAEIGRAKAAASFTKDDAKYVGLEFPKEMDASLVVKYVVDESK